MRSSGVSPVQFELLATIAERPSLSQKEIASRLSLDQTTLSRNLKNLIEQDWVTPAASHNDGRQVVYVISGKGRSALRRALPRWQRAQARVEQTFGKDREAISSTLDRLITVLQ